MNYVAPLSPHDLIQEHYPGDEYKVLVCCQLLNQTSRKQLDKIVDTFFDRWPNAQSLSSADPGVLADILKPLGLYNRRSSALRRFASEYLSKHWTSPQDLYGCGKYANDAWSIFIKGAVADVQPEDHALNDYHDWYMKEIHNVK